MFKNLIIKNSFQISNFKLKIGLLVVLVVLVVFPEKASAAELSLGVSPPILQIIADPPASVKAPITIKNLGDEPVMLNIQFKPFTAKESENGEIKYINPSESFGENPLIFHFIQIMDNERVVETLTLAPRQEKNLTLHAGILKDELPGDYYFSIVFVRSSEELSEEGLALSEAEGSSLAQTTGGVAINVLLSIGPDRAQGTIEEFSAPFFAQKGPVPFTVRVKNTGKNFFTPNGTILIKNMFGQTVGKVDLLPVNILAGTVRSIPDLLQSPDSTPSSTLLAPRSPAERGEVGNSPKALWHESFLLGPYTATLNLALSDKGPLFQKTIHFVGFPAEALAGLVLAL
ncbi:MAG: hypothetical protein Q7S38_00240, partial [bacterium]|nr:hypothetical protein [bacterium]